MTRRAPPPSRRGRLALAVATCGLAISLGHAASAHDLRPALLSVEERTPGDFWAELRAPVDVTAAERPAPIFPAAATGVVAVGSERVGDSVIQRFRFHAVGGIAHARVGVRWARPTGGGEVLIRLAFADGRVQLGRAIAAAGTRDAVFEIPGAPGRLDVVRTYTILGVHHILTGFDHLAFVLGLILLTPSFARLWRTITAFTLAHSLSLALAAFRIVQVPPAPTEAAIALSIVLVARQAWLASDGRLPLGEGRPFAMAFLFGLLHGLGFAGALAEVGLPNGEAPLALFTFNCGVELGQLAFVVVVLTAATLLRRVPLAKRRAVRLAPAYAIGTLAVFWCVDRVRQFWA